MSWNAFIVAALVVAILVVLAVATRRRRGSGTDMNLLPEAREVQVRPARLTALRRVLGAELASADGRMPPHEKEIVRHALWMAMLLEAGADNVIDEAEIAFVSKLYGEIVTREPAREQIAEAGDSVLADRDSALREVAKAARVTADSKRIILMGAFLVSVANDALEPSEAVWLNAIADALNVPQADRAGIFAGFAESVDLH